MSALFNPLDEFQSYSVHYVLLACRTTEDAKAYMDESKNVSTLAAIDQVKLLGGTVPYGDSDTAFLVLDTRRFSQFSVTSLKYEVLINGIEKAQSHANLATEVDMQITDSSGIAFINFFQWLMNTKMQTNFDGIIFMLRLVFVGHKPDRSTSTVQTLTIPMHLFKMEANLDFAKGVYNTTWMPNMNFNTKRHERWLNIYTASSYFSGVGKNNLGSLIDSFEKRLNEDSQRYFDTASTTLESASSQRNKNGKFGRLVQYQLTIPDSWKNFIFDGGTVANSTETIFQADLNNKDKSVPKTVGKPIDSNMSVSAGMRITRVLDLLFQRVPEISDLGNGKKEKDSVTFYKHFVGITSDDTSLVVHIDVVQFRVPNVLAITSSSTNSQNTADFYQEIDGKRVPKNYAEFDYIFTGKNKDILNFDMKLQDLQFMLASNLQLGAGAMLGVTEYGQEGIPADQKVNKTAELVNARAYDPLLLPKNTEAELSNFSRFTSLKQAANKELIKSSQDYTRNLSMFYASSPITAVMTIKGNPDVMAKFNQDSFLKHTSPKTDGAPVQGSSTQSSSGTSKDAYRADLETRILKTNPELAQSQGGVIAVTKSSLGNQNYATAPVFVKLNVKGPNVDFQTGELVQGEDFTKDILTDVYFVVMKVTNMIEGGSFTQQLELYSHNVFGNGKVVSSDKTPRVK